MILSSFNSKANTFIIEHKYKGWDNEKIIKECTAFLTEALDLPYRYYAEDIALQALAAYEASTSGNDLYIDFTRTTSEALFIRRGFGTERQKWVFTIADIMKALEENKLVSLPIPSRLSFLDQQKKTASSEIGAD